MHFVTCFWWCIFFIVDFWQPGWCVRSFFIDRKNISVLLRKIIGIVRFPIWACFCFFFVDCLKWILNWVCFTKGHNIVARQKIKWKMLRDLTEWVQFISGSLSTIVREFKVKLQFIAPKNARKFSKSFRFQIQQS